MTRTLARPTSIGQYPRPVRLTPEQYMAKQGHCTEGTAHQWMCGPSRVNDRAARIVEALVQTGNPGRADRWLIPVWAARNGITQERLTDPRILAAQLADLAEDRAEAEYNANRCRTTAIPWLRKLEHQVAESIQLIQSIKTEYEL